MSFKTIFIIVVTVLATIILMKNTDEVTFWIFGETYVSKLAILGVMFVAGFIVGFLVGRPRQRTAAAEETEPYTDEIPENRSSLSDEDRDYIS